MIDPRTTEATDRGLAAVAIQDWPAAVDAFQQAIHFSPGLVAAWYNLANARMRIREYDTALTACLRALRINPAYPNLQLLTGNAHAELGQYLAAMEHYVTAVEQEPRQMIAHINLAVAFERLGMYEEACEAYDIGIMTGADRSTALSAMFYAAMCACNWDIAADARERFMLYVNETGGENRAAPFQLLAMYSTRAMQLEAARNYAKRTFTEQPLPPEP